MSTAVAETLVAALGTYAVAGFVFAVPFVWRLVGILDPAARHGTVGFRLLIVPGVMALWPLLLVRLVGGGQAPPDEWNAHRAAAKAGTP